MIFQKCAKCGGNLGPHNTHKISMMDDDSELSGLYFTHSREDCHSTGFLPLSEVKKRAENKADGNPYKQLEIEWYQERLKELK